MNKLVSNSSPVERFPDPRKVRGDAPLTIDTDLSVEALLEAYSLGFYPKPENALDEVTWWCPDPRTVLFLNEFKPSRSLRKSVKNRNYSVTLNQAFGRVIENCAERLPPRKFSFAVPDNLMEQHKLDWLQDYHKAGHLKVDFQEGVMNLECDTRERSYEIFGPLPTWISQEIIDAYQELHRHGHAHSVETWHKGNLVGGLYGVSLGRIFFGESMFSLKSDASKVALYHLTHHLRHSGFELIDCQEPTPLLFSLGAREITRNSYLDILERSVNLSLSSSVWLDWSDPLNL